MYQEVRPELGKRAATIGPARRAARVLIAPYLRPMAQWNIDLALLRQLLKSRHLHVSELSAVNHQLLTLQQDVWRSRKAFAAAVAGQPQHDVIDDLDRSYRRLALQLKATVGSAGPA